MHSNYIKLLFTAFLYILFVFFAQPVAAHEEHSSVPEGFSKTEIASGISQPTAIEQAPDGRIFVLRKGGYVLVIKNNSLLSTPALTLPVSADGERGLLGIALDPSFAANGYVYLYYTRANPLENRVSRFTMTGDMIDPGSEVVLLKTTQSLGLVHHAGTVRIGHHDQKLWISIGNNNIATNPQDLTTLHGKIIRINRDGSIPSDNPFYGQAGKEQRIWAYGLRNPFRFDFLPDGRPIVGDVGDESYEEINVIEKGGNYGYPQAEGMCTNCSSINPLYVYPHNGASASVTGGFVYSGTSFPTSYNGAYFYGDYAKNFIRSFKIVDGSVIEDAAFDTDPGTVVDMLQGNDGSLYYLTIVPGAVYKISYSTQNQPPTAKLSASPTVGLTPLSVQFSSEGSFDPEENPLTYLWNFGDGTTSTQPNPTHTYTQNGTYTASLTVSDGSLSDSTISFPIYAGKQGPTASIITPIADSTYNAGSLITLRANGSDPKDGDLPNSAFSWSVIFHHGTHTHPFLDTLPASKSATFTIPDTGNAAADTSYEIVLTVTNSQGFTATQKRFIYPNTVTLNFASNTPGAMMTLDGIPISLPYQTQAVVGFQRVIDVPNPQTINGENYDFSLWSDGGKKLHTITTPAANTTYTVSFSNVGTGTGSIHFRVRQAASGYPDGVFVNGATAKLTDTSGTTVLATAKSAPIGSQDGWVLFDNIPVGSYAVLSYKSGYIGTWKQTDCSVGPGDISDSIKVQNSTTENFVGVIQTPISVTKNGVTWCKDVGLKVAENGNLYVRAMLVERDPQIPYQRPSYIATEMLNGVTVKLTDTTGEIVKATTMSKTAPWGGDGWIIFENIKAGNYGLLGYKNGYVGYAKATSCSTMEINNSLQNANTDGNSAAWNSPVTIAGGNSTNCYDIGLLGFGNMHYRVREFDSSGNWTGKYINGATAKLTDPTGTIVYKTAVSGPVNGQDGWVIFDHVESGYYAVLTYKSGLSGYWLQQGCQGAAPTTTNATIQNSTTEQLVAAYQRNFRIAPNETLFCRDSGLKNASITSSTGSIHFRVREFAANGTWTGNFLNGVTAKLLDETGTVIATQQSEKIGSQDGWVLFQNVDANRTYRIVTYKSGLSGYWKQTGCNGTGTSSNATIQNSTTENQVGVLQEGISVTANQIYFCKDAGLKDSSITTQRGSIHFRVREVDSSGIPTGDFISGATALLLNETGTQIINTTTSETLNGQDGWVLFDNVPTGTYAILAYKDNYIGAWKQTDCFRGPGTTDNAPIQNQNTAGHIAAWQTPVDIAANAITFCKDVGLRSSTAAQNGRLYLRVLSFDANGVFSGTYLNGATAKLTDTSGQTVLATQTSHSVDGQDGWLFFEKIPTGTYGLLVYKPGYKGYWKGQGCSQPGTTTNATLTNSNTEGKIAVWTHDIPLTADQITFCRDAGLVDENATLSVSSPLTASSSAQ